MKPLEIGLHPPLIEAALLRIKKMQKPNSPLKDYDFRTLLESLTDFPPGLMTRLEQMHRIPCERCGNCCRECSPIAISDRELRKIAKYLKLTPYTVRRKHHLTKTPELANHWNIKGKPCPFLGGINHCKIYPVHPESCRNYPFVSTENVARRLGAATLDPFCGRMQQFVAYQGIAMATIEVLGLTPGVRSSLSTANE